jgi:hypothetical protein
MPWPRATDDAEGRSGAGGRKREGVHGAHSSGSRCDMSRCNPTPALTILSATRFGSVWALNKAFFLSSILHSLAT